MVIYKDTDAVSEMTFNLKQRWKAAMQKDEVRQIVMALLSGYLAYIGIGLIRDHDPSASVVYLIAAVIFILFGGASCIWYVRLLIQGRRKKTGSDQDKQQRGLTETEQDHEE